MLGLPLFLQRFFFLFFYLFFCFSFCIISYPRKLSLFLLTRSSYCHSRLRVCCVHGKCRLDIIVILEHPIFSADTWDYTDCDLRSPIKMSLFSCFDAYLCEKYMFSMMNNGFSAAVSYIMKLDTKVENKYSINNIRRVRNIFTKKKSQQTSIILICHWF